jgi:hypothetical protein
MWTVEQRQTHDRAGLRYPSDPTDEEWPLVEPLIPPARRGGRRRTADVREVLTSIVRLASWLTAWCGGPSADHGRERGTGDVTLTRGLTPIGPSRKALRGWTCPLFVARELRNSSGQVSLGGEGPRCQAPEGGMGPRSSL